MSTTDKDLVIPLSKKKIVLLMLGALGFVALGAWVLAVADEIPRRDPAVLRAAGIVAIVFFGFASVYALRKLFDAAPGLIINSRGIVDNSSAIAAGLIPWEQITELTVTTVQSQRLLTIHVRSPDLFLTQGNFMRRMAAKVNYKHYGSPVQISANALKVSFDELLALVRHHFETHRRS